MTKVKMSTTIANMIMGKRDEENAKITKLKAELNAQFYNAYLNGCRNNFFINLSNDQEMSNILLSLTLSSDFRLKTQSLQLFYELHSQINLTKLNIENSILLDSTNTKMSYLESLNLSRALKRLAETTEKWYLDEGSDEFEAVQTILSHIEDHLLQLQKNRRNMPYTEPISLDGIDDESHGGNPMEGPKDLPELEEYFCKEIKYVVNPFYQNIFRHLEIYESLLSLINTDFNFMQELKPESSPKLKAGDKATQAANSYPHHRKLISRIYLILAYACIDNQENKSKVEDLVQSTLIDHFLQDPSNPGLHCFIYEYFTDNFHTVKVEELSSLMQPILKMISERTIEDSRKSVLLSALSQLCRYQGVINQNNQNYLMQKALPELNRNPIIDLANPKNVDHLASLLHNPHDVRAFGKALVHCIDPLLNYYCSFLKYIKRCGEGRNNQTEYVAQIMLPLKSILQLFEIRHKNIAFKDTLLGFFWKIHVSSAKRMPVHFEDVVLKIMQILASELIEFVRDKEENNQICDIYILIGTQMEKFDVFKLRYFGKLIQCCFSLTTTLKCLKNINKGSVEENLIADLIEGVFKFYHMGSEEQYRDTCLHFMLHLMLKTGPDIALNAKEANREEFFDLKNSIMSKGLKDIKQKAVKLTTKIIKHSLSMKKYYKNSTKSMTITTMRHRTLLLESSGGQLPVEAALVEYLRISQADFFHSEAFESLAEKEFQGIVDAINMLETENKSRHKRKTAHSMKTISEFFHSMIQFLFWQAEDIQEKLILIIIQIFINFLKGTDNNEKNSGMDEKTEEFKSQKLFSYRQNFLIDLDIVNLVCKLLSINRSLIVNKQTILLGTYIMEDGNSKAQKKFYNYFLEDKTNKVIRELYEIIDASFETIEHYMQNKMDIRIDNILKEGEVKFSTNSFKGMNEAEKEKIKEKEEEAEESVTNIKESIKVMKQTLRFLQLLCEGHYLDMQNYFRDQHQYELASLKRDLVETGAKMFGSFTKINNKNSVNLGIQIIDFLVEIIQGPCVENQVKLEACKVIEYCKDLLNDLASKKEFVNLWRDMDTKSNDSMSRLVAKTITLLGAMMEGNQGKIYREQIEENLDFKFLIEILEVDLTAFIKRKKGLPPSAEVNVEDFLKNYSKTATKNFFDEKLLESFQNFFFIQMVCSDRTIIQQYKRTLDPGLILAYNFYEENSRSIEVVFNGYIQKYYFPIHPACSYLSDTMKENFVNTFNRESPNEKMIQFMRATPKYIDYMDYTIARKTSKIPITNATFTWVRDILLMVGIIINFVNFIWTTQEIHHSEGNPVLDIEYSREFIMASSILHLSLTVVTFMTWLYVEGPIVQMDAWREKLIDIQSNISSHVDNSEEREICKIILQKNVVDQTFIEKQNLLKYHNKLKKHETGHEMLSHLDLIFYLTFSVIKNPDCGYFLSMILVSALAFGFEMPYLYTIFLFDLVHKFDTLKNVIKAFSYHKSQLLFTIILEAILIYIYSSFAYYYVDETFYSFLVGSNGENLCVSMWHCFLSIYSLGPRTDRGIGNVMTNTSYDEEHRTLYYVRFLYDFTFFLAINLIFLNMLSGLVIDAFAELRDQKTVTDDHKRNVCYVCSIIRNRLEKEAEGFEIHTTQSHYLWDYLYFIYHLKMKPKTEYNGVEGYIADKVSVEDISWLPIERSLAIENKKGMILDAFIAVGNLENELAELQTSTKKI